MLARVFEEAGLVTVAVALIREHVVKVKPPRALYVPFPLGFPLGRPNEPQLQHRVIAAAFELLRCESGPVLADFPEVEVGPVRLVQAYSAKTAEDLRERDPADELTAIRPFYEQWTADHGGRTMVGLTGIPARRFRGIVRFLQAISRGEDADLQERPADVSLAQFIRYCALDLKSLYYEARMVQRPDVEEVQLHEWFWGQTAVGRLLVAVAERMLATGDPEMKYMSWAIARTEPRL